MEVANLVYWDHLILSLKYLFFSVFPYPSNQFPNSNQYYLKECVCQKLEHLSQASANDSGDDNKSACLANVPNEPIDYKPFVGEYGNHCEKAETKMVQSKYEQQNSSIDSLVDGEMLPPFAERNRKDSVVDCQDDYGCDLVSECCQNRD